jgi:hypothetical protein
VHAIYQYDKYGMSTLFHFSKEEHGYLNPVSSSTSNWLGVSIEATGTT